MDQHHYNFWAVIEPSEIKGVWTAHALDFGVVTQGDSVEHALKMLFEATVMIIAEDLSDNRNPEDRRSPKKYYDSLWDALAMSKNLAANQLSSKEAVNACSVVVNMALTINCVTKGSPISTLTPEFTVPLALLIEQDMHANC